MHHAFEKSRENMVEGQIRPSKVTDIPLLTALRAIPRERFVPHHLQSIAYVDEDIAVGNGRYLCEPVITARLIQAARVRDGEVVLDIGCGTGYSSAILSHLAGTVVGVETDHGMAQEAGKVMNDLGIVNTVVVAADEPLCNGYAKQAPYDVILINGAVSAVPDCIKEQLADGGRLMAVVTEKRGMGRAVLVTRHGDVFVEDTLFDASTPVLAGFEAKEEFSF